MARSLHFRHSIRGSCPFTLIMILLVVAMQRAHAQDLRDQSSSSQTDASSIEKRLLSLEREYSSLSDENRRLSIQLDEMRKSIDSPATNSMADFVSSPTSPFRSGYDNGIFISTQDADQFPFELRFNNQAQIRYAGFAPGVETWTDSSGATSPVDNRSAFELVRGRAIFSGHAISKQLGYNLAIDYTTVSATQLNFWNYWISYEFSRSMTVYAGQTLVPGSREWMTPPIYYLGPDASLATTFFRPSLSQGVWISGEPIDDLHYRAMISNGFNTLGSSQQQLDSRMTLSGSTWFEPLGDFGQGFSDFEWHSDPVLRFGTSLTCSPNEGQQGSPDLPENADIRLTNGTLITQPGALGPGFTLNRYTVGLAAIDAGWKYQGVSVSGELYLRDLFDLKGTGAQPRSSVFDFGGYVQAGCFVLPGKLELYGRTSQITGAFGSGAEYASGLNYYWLTGKQNLRFTLDAAWVVQSPADQARTDYHAGDTGLLIRSQVQFFF